MINNLKIFIALFAVSAMLITSCTKEDSIIDTPEQQVEISADVESSELEARNRCGSKGATLTITQYFCHLRVTHVCGRTIVVTGPNGVVYECNGGDCKDGTLRLKVPSGLYRVKAYTSKGFLEKNQLIRIDASRDCGSGFTFDNIAGSGNNNNNANNNSCGTTAGADVFDIRKTKVKVSWFHVSTASKYQIRYRVAGTQSYLKRSSSSTSRSIGNLKANTTYEYSVRTQCNSGQKSSWSATRTFKTAG